MTVYVDEAIWKKPNGRVSYAHLVADSLEELHLFANSIGIKSHWFHRSSKYPHYDINQDQRLKAIEAGAVEVTSVDIVKMFKTTQA